MNWKAEAMERLQKYDAMRTSVQNIPAELRRLEVEACSIRAARTEEAPVRGSGGRREDAMLSNVVRRQQLQWALDQAKLWVEITERGLQALNPEEKLILHRFYLYPERGCVDRLCQELGVEQSSVYRKRDRALNRFTVAVYGCPGG